MDFSRERHLFKKWLHDATEQELNDPNSMYLATVDDEGMPNIRVVLLKDLNKEGFVFYTNIKSSKGIELKNNPSAALCFHWKSLQRKINVRGHVAPVSSEQADAYFQSRDRRSRIGAWASKQSTPLPSKSFLLKRAASVALKFGAGPIARPSFWSGFCLQPHEITFWEGDHKLETIPKGDSSAA